MAHLFLDEHLKYKFYDEYRMIVDNIKITKITKFHKGILKIDFESEKFDENQTVLAKLRYQNDKAFICFKKYE